MVRSEQLLRVASTFVEPEQSSARFTYSAQSHSRDAAIRRDMRLR